MLATNSGSSTFLLSKNTNKSLRNILPIVSSGYETLHVMSREITDWVCLTTGNTQGGWLCVRCVQHTGQLPQPLHGGWNDKGSSSAVSKASRLAACYPTSGPVLLPFGQGTSTEDRQIPHSRVPAINVPWIMASLAAVSAASLPPTPAWLRLSWQRLTVYDSS